MADRPSVLILHNAVGPGAAADALDVLRQAEWVDTQLRALGCRTETLPLDLGLDRAAETLRARLPDVVFNLVEALEDDGRLVHVATALLDHLGLAYTGTATEGLLLTSDKILTKQWLTACGVATPTWWEDGLPPPTDGYSDGWILKPVMEEASISINDESVVTSFDQVPDRLQRKRRQARGRWFAERYIEGREINVSLLADRSGPELLPIAEIEFLEYPDGKPRIVSYAAKWLAGSFECQHTRRCFLDEAAERTLCQQLRSIALTCWRVFRLGGYARVDFRVDAAGKPWVLEVNANPCISPEAGFAAAVAEAGLPFGAALERILSDAQEPDRL